MGAYDKTLRELFQNIPVKLIQLLTGQKISKLIDSHFPKVEEREADLVVELENGEIFHLEIQSNNDKNMPRRMLYYALAIEKLYKKFPIQTVLYVGIEKNNIKNFINLPRLKYNYKVVDIKEINCNILIESEFIEDNILSILCNIENSDKFFEKLNKKLIYLNNKQREDYLRKLIIISRLRPNIYEKFKNYYKEHKMPFTLDKKYDPLYKEGWNEAWNEAWSEAWDEAEKKRKIKDALIVISKFGVSIDEVVKEFNIPKETILKELNKT